MSYYINLSILSNKQDNPHGTERKKNVSAEARRILSLCEGRPITDDNMAREAGGRPFFPGSDMDFSISHSGNLAAVSLVTGKGLRTGCDVELVRPRKGAGKIAEELFTASEREYIGSGGGFDLTRFYHIWTLKECFLKLKGLSVFDMRGAPSFVSGEGTYTFSTAVSSPILFNLYELSGNADERYILAIVIEGTEIKQPGIRWFSQEDLSCKSIAKINAAPSPAETVSPKI